ncbi:unnamed protein product [Pedinophyceae sp. YPF-701]|nr:unnamed protein product [Pedinophyceae sp. YPF-701]
MPGNGSGTARARAAAGIRSAFIVAIWMWAGSLMIFVTRLTMVEQAFPARITLLAAASATSTLAGFASRLRPAILPYPRRTPKHLTLRHTGPELSWGAAAAIAAAANAALLLGCVANGHLSLSFVTQLKAAVPLITLGALLFLRVEAWSRRIAAPVAGVALGVLWAAREEARGGRFAWRGVVAFLLSAACEAARVALTERAVRSQRVPAARAMARVSLACTLMLAAAAVAVEWVPGGRAERAAGAWRLMVRHPMVYATWVWLGTAVQMTTLWAVREVGALTLKASACLRNVLVIVGAVCTGEVVTARQAGGYAVAVASFLLYSRERAAEAARAAEGAAGRARAKTKTA